MCVWEAVYRCFPNVRVVVCVGVVGLVWWWLLTIGCVVACDSKPLSLSCLVVTNVCVDTGVGWFCFCGCVVCPVCVSTGVLGVVAVCRCCLSSVRVNGCAGAVGCLSLFTFSLCVLTGVVRGC